MNVVRNPYLLYPLIFLAALFVFDKIFLLPEVRHHFVQKGGMIYYEQRRLQMRDLQEALNEGLDASDRTVVIFGDSRSLALGELTLLGSKHLQERYFNYNIFNFAAPQALPAYYAFLAQEIFRGNKRPKYLIVGISPDSFNQYAGIMAHPVMSYGLTPEFIEAHKTVISREDYEAYLTQRRFALYGLGFSFKTLIERLRGGLGRAEDKELFVHIAQMREKIKSKSESLSPLERILFAKSLKQAIKPSLRHYSITSTPWKYILDMGRGSFYGWIQPTTDAKLRAETEKLRKIYFENFQASQEQFYFYRQMLALARLSGAKVIVFWPRVNPHLRELYPRYPAIGAIWEELRRIAQENGAEALNMNDPSLMKCDSFYDASHMSGLCFPELQTILLDRLTKN